MGKYVIALYIRLSVEDSKTESLSIHNQRIVLNRFVETLSDVNGAEILEFVDNGYSGTSFERPAVQELLTLVQAGKVNCIIVRDFSRFGRNSIETGYFIEQVFPLFHTRFISVNDNFDTINYKGDTGGMDVAFKYLINEYYSKDLSKKSKTAKYLKMMNGEYQSKTCCYGYKKGSNNRLEIDREVSPTVEFIFDMALKKHTASQIVQALYAKGIPTPGEYKASKGNKTHDVSRCHNIWQRSTVLRILVDERYIGTYVMGKRTVKKVGGRSVKLKDESTWFKIPDHHPAIVDKAVFEQVQSQLMHFKSEKKNKKVYPLREKVICGCCEHAMSRVPKKEPVFTCRYTRVAENFQCHGLTIAEKDLESLLFDIVSKQAEILMNAPLLGSIENLGIDIEKKIEYEKRMRKFQDDRRDLYERFLALEISVEEYTLRKADCNVELQKLEQLYSTIVSDIAKSQTDSETREKMLAVAKDISAEPRFTKTLADALIDKVYVYQGNKIEIVWKVQDFCVGKIF